MNRYIFTSLVIILCENAEAQWVRIGENARSVAYIDTEISRSNDTATYYTLFDYKNTQVSPRSGRQYQSEKARHYTECRNERDRVLSFSWYSEEMGHGSVVYTRNKPTNWEPTDLPGSYGNAFWKIACGNN